MQEDAPRRKTILQFEGVTKGYGTGAARTEVLKSVSFQILKGEIVALVGPSGSGKSTLLQIAGLLDRGETGKVSVDGQECDLRDDAKTSTFRGCKIGFVYQFHRLFPEFTALENVMIPQLLVGVPEKDAKNRAENLLKKFGLGHRVTHRPGELSGGERQRTAIARALANKPVLLLADEPTGNLDGATADIIFREFLDFVRDEGSAALVATHNIELAAAMNRVIGPNGEPLFLKNAAMKTGAASERNFI